MNIKRILIPIDFSDQALIASKVAAKIAKKTNSEIFLLHMIEMPSGIVDMGSGNTASTPAALFFMQKVHEKFDEFKALPFFKGVKINEEVRFHKAFSGILEYKKELHIDLIVMGSHGATGLQGMLVGSNTEKVVRNSTVPVLVVKKDIDNFEINNITYASDFSDETKHSFQRVIDFANAFNATLHLVYINTPKNFESTNDSKKKMEMFINDFAISKHTLNIYNDLSIEKGIICFSKDKTTDLIAIHTHGSSGLLNLFTNHVSEDLVNNALKPVITFKL